MEKIRLWDNTACQIVTEIAVPIFSPRCEVFIWGMRVFVFNKELQKYLEAFAYMVPG